MGTHHDPSNGGGKILDQDTIDSLIELGGDDESSLLLELIELFVDDANDRMQKISTAISSGDMDTIEKMAHALKSASANIGALPFSNQCLELEQTAKGEPSEGVPELVQAATAMYSEVGVALAALKSTHTA